MMKKITDRYSSTTQAGPIHPRPWTQSDETVAGLRSSLSLQPKAAARGRCIRWPWRMGDPAMLSTAETFEQNSFAGSMLTATP